jgi:hypothetical protein
MVLVQLRLVIEEIELRGSANHMQVNHVSGLGRKVRQPGIEIRCRVATAVCHQAVLQQRCERRRSQANPSASQKLTARLQLGILLEWVHHF